MGLSEKTILVIVLAIVLILLGVLIIYFAYNETMFNIRVLFEVTIPEILSKWSSAWKITQ